MPCTAGLCAAPAHIAVASSRGGHSESKLTTVFTATTIATAKAAGEAIKQHRLVKVSIAAGGAAQYTEPSQAFF